MSEATTDPWELRFDWILRGLLWTSYALGAGLAFLAYGLVPQSITAAVAAGAYAVVLQAIPNSVRNREPVADALAVSGVFVALGAVGMTGGLDSSYLLYLMVPIFFASAFRGFGTGVVTATLTAVGLALVLIATGNSILEPAFFQISALVVLIALTFSQARRLLIEEKERTDRFREDSIQTASRLERLSTAHTLLISLADLADSAELNRVTVGEAALRDLALVVPFRGGTVTVVDPTGDMVVARRGATGGSDTRSYPIMLGGRKLGKLSLWPSKPGHLDGREPLINEALRPVALALDNITLIQDIAGRAVKEERVRLARELHDDIAPSLASLGLSLDMAIHQHEPEPKLANLLEVTRNHLTRLVEDVRKTVADLRAEEVRSLVEHANSIAAEVGADGPAVIVELDERRPPRASDVANIAAIMAEAVRNAVDHGEARSIMITGSVERERGCVTIADDGIGFDISVSPRDHFGLIGMKERAEQIGAILDVASRPGEGSTITIEWGAS